MLGAGPGGYTAAFRAADLGRQVVLVERWPTLGGVCLNVGCIPSKALLHAAKVIAESEEMGHFGVKFAAPTVDIDALRGWKDGVVKKLTGGLSGLAKARKVTVVSGIGRFTSLNQLEVEDAKGGKKTVSFEQAIIAAGSEPVTLPFIPHADPRVINSTGALELGGVPKRLLVVGGGIIGLEMATVYHALGAKVTIVELMDQIIPGADKDLVTPLHKRIAKQYENIFLKAKVTKVEAKPEGLVVSFEGGSAPATDTFDRILVAVGRKPNGKMIGAENAGVIVDERGFIPVDKQLRTNVPHIFAIGDVVGQPMLAHKAVHEGKTAAEAASGMKSFFDAAVIPSVAYTDPEVAWVGLTENEAKAKGIKYGKGAFPWAASGRSLALGRDEGMTKLLFDEATHRVLGCGIVGPNAGELVAEAGLAIEMGADASDIGLTIHAHPDPVGDHRHGGRDVRGHHHRPDRAQEEALSAVDRRERIARSRFAHYRKKSASVSALMPVSWIWNSAAASASLLAWMIVLPPEVEEPACPGRPAPPCRPSGTPGCRRRSCWRRCRSGRSCRCRAEVLITSRVALPGLLSATPLKS